MQVTFLLISLIFLSCSGTKQISPTGNTPGNLTAGGPQNVSEFSLFIDSLISGNLKKENIPGAAFVFVKDGKIFYSKGYGMANLEKKTEVDPSKTIFRIGSISKVFTADALVQLADKKLIDLNENVNSYLKTISIPATYSPVTATHILTHTAGLDEIRPGTQAATAAGLLPLSRFLKDKIVRLWEPGQVVMYSTYGITLGGLIVEEKTGLPFETYLTENIFTPLQMNRTNINVPEKFKEDVAMGYEITDGMNVPQGWEWYHTTPASSINSTAEDMAHWLIAHLNKGKYGEKSIMSAEMMKEMTSGQFSMHPKIPGMAYGFFEEHYINLRFLHHGGNMAGFNSLAVLIPEMNAGFFFVSQHEGSSFRDHLQWGILEKYYKKGNTPIKPQSTTANAERAKLFEGSYKYNGYCHSCNRPSNNMTFTVTANTDGTIQFNGRKWVETEDKLFVRDDGQSKVGFRADSSGKITHMYLGGFWNFEKM